MIRGIILKSFKDIGEVMITPTWTMQDKYRQADDEADDLFNSLVQCAFKGQL